MRTHLRRDEVARGFFDGDLSAEGVGHLASVPVEALGVVVIAVEEVDLAGGLLDLRVEEEHLDEGARSALADADDDRLWEVSASTMKVDRCGEEERRAGMHLRYQVHLLARDPGSGVQTVNRAVVHHVEREEKGDQHDREKGGR